MGADAAWALQQAIHGLLAGDATLGLLAPGGVHDHAPEDTAFPWVQIGPVAVRDFSAKTFAGAEHAIELRAWSRGRGRREAKAIAGRLHELLHGAGFAIAGHTLVDLRFDGLDVGVEPDGLTTLARARFRAITQAE
jgi:hypothetical protein